MLNTSIKLAWRNIIKNPVAGLINITGLSLGMAAAVLILLWVQNELSFNSYHRNARNIYYLNVGTKQDQMFGATPFLLGPAVQEQAPGIDRIARLMVGNGFTNPVISVNDQYFKEKNLVFTEKSWFEIFDYNVVEGNISTFNEDANGVVLTESLARKYFGMAPAFGATIYIDSVPRKVQAIVKDFPVNSSFRYDIFLPVKMLLKTHDLEAAGWKVYNFQTFVQLKKGTNAMHIQGVVNRIINAHLSVSLANNGRPDSLTAVVMPLSKIHFIGSPYFRLGNKQTVAIFSILGFLLLSIACINYVNLSTAKASLRSKEVSIKKIVGAGKINLFLQFMVESIVTSVLALLITMLLISLALPWFNGLTDQRFTLSLNSGALWLVLSGTLLLAVLLTGIYPALLLSSFKPLNVLKGNNVLAIKDSSLRKFLVTVQFTVAIALAVCTTIVLKQMHFIRHTNDGYTRSRIFSFAIPHSWASSGYATDQTSFINSLKNEFRKESSIEAVTVSNDAIQNIMMSMAGIIDWKGKQPDDNPQVALLSVDPDFTSLFRLQLVEGRWYEKDNAADRHNYILTETTVAKLGLRRPYLGQYFSMMNDTGRIIGIVKDFHFRSFHSKIDAAILVNRADLKGTFFVQSAPGKLNLAVTKVEDRWKKFFPKTPFEPKFMDAEFEKMYRADTKTATLVTVFAGLAIFISCLGIFGLVAFIAQQRTKEIGIRKVLGASIINIVSLLSKDFIKLVIGAFIIASPLAWWAMHRWLADFAYRIEISWWMFAAAGMAAISLALITSGIQSIRAAVVNPATTLRTE